MKQYSVEKGYAAIITSETILEYPSVGSIPDVTNDFIKYCNDKFAEEAKTKPNN